MKKKQNVSLLKNCFGCGVCSSVCGKKAISMKLNKNGFYYPAVDLGLCVDCGLCLQVCAFSVKEKMEDISTQDCWAAWSKNNVVRNKCSSGGVGFEICKHLLETGYKAVVCRYDNKEQRPEHFIATTEEELIQSIGSKYVQSFTQDAFRQIDRKQKYVVTGTPCQIDSFRRMVQKYHCEANFVLMDFFCHGVPSMWAWNSYLTTIEPYVGKVVYASWRNKNLYLRKDIEPLKDNLAENFSQIDWHDSYNILIKGESGSFIQSRMSQGDLFYKLFLGDLCLGPQCQKDCKYKCNHSAADIRIGDMWGNTYIKEKKGVSSLIAFTNKGKEIVSSMKGIALHNHPFEVVTEGQMKQNAKKRLLTPVCMFLLRKRIDLKNPLFKFLIKAQDLVNAVSNLF